jgi:hypothetical protein
LITVNNIINIIQKKKNYKKFKKKTCNNLKMTSIEVTDAVAPG